MASMLDGFRRPAVIFNRANKQHRKWAHQFLKDRGWRNCPVQFILPEGEGDQVRMIMRELSRYYLSKEFGALPMDDHEYNYQRHIETMPQIHVLKHRG